MARGREGAYYAVGNSTLEGRLTQARADALDRLDATITSRMAITAAPTYNASTAAASNGVNAALLDSGPLAAGNYDIDVFAVIYAAAAPTGAVWGGAQLEHRNAANAANLAPTPLQIHSVVTSGVTPDSGSWGPGVTHLPLRRVVVALNERFRINKLIADIAAGRSQYFLVVRPSS